MKTLLKTAVFLLISLALFFLLESSYAANQTINLHVGYKTVNFTGKPIKALAINHQIPAPVLHFQQGDFVTINVYNHLNEGTAIHWHGLLVPWKMDGVSNLTQKPIPPGGVFHYKFRLKQSGTYWYHSHNGLQEQQGLYGAFIIDPPKQRYHADKDFTVVLSDWTNSRPEKIFANLKKEGEFYSSLFPTQSSLVDFLRDYINAPSPHEREYLMDAYWAMQKMRMGLYDINDVAYDAFLLNGKTKADPWIKKVSKGDIVRLRFIDAGSATQFHIKISGTDMRIIHVQGNDIKPCKTSHFMIAPGETYDVLIKIKSNKPYIIYAESSDKIGAAYGILTTQKNQKYNLASIKPFPKPSPQIMMMNHHAMTDQVSPTKYDAIQSVKITNNPNKKVHVIHMMLTGFMNRFMWFINGKPEWEAKPISIKKGERYRIIFMNHSMMHHPMHLHGHWFILRNGHGSHDPLIHTVDVPPNATITVDFDADNSGQWYFHCHNLYHMKAGMAAVFQYKNVQVPPYLFGHRSGWFAKTHLHLGGDFNKKVYEGELNTLIGSDTNKWQLYSNDLEINDGTFEKANIDSFYWHLIDQFWAIKGGVNYTYRPAKKSYFQPGIGIEGVTPFFINTNLRTYLHNGSVKLDLEFDRETHLYKRLFFNTDVRGIFASKNIKNDLISKGLNSMELTIGPSFLVNPNMSLFAQYERTKYYGTLKKWLREDDEPSIENRFMIGLSFLF